MTNSQAHPLISKLLWCSGLLLVTSWLANVGAQPPMGGADPFGEGAAQPVAPKKGPVAAPDVLPANEPLVIIQLRESNPKSAAELVSAASAVLRFGRPDECKRYLVKFLEAKFPEDDLSVLPAKYGTAFFLDLSTNEKLQPEGAQVAHLVMTAARKASENPARLAALVKTLSDPSYEAAATALTRLEQAGPNLVGPVLQALSDSNRSAEHPRLYAALRDLAETTEAPLIATLAAAPETQQIIAANVLGEIHSRNAVRHLLAPALAAGTSEPLQAAARRALTKIMGGVPQQTEAELYLLRQFAQLRDGQHPFQVDADNNTVVWQWDIAKSVPASSLLPVEDALRQLSARLATDLYKLKPTSREYQKLRLMHYLEFAKVMGGMARPLPADSPAFVLAKEAGVQMTAEVLALAMAERHHAAAIAAAEILGLIGAADLLASDGPAPGVLSTALTHADRRIRLAAALAIVKLKPATSFPGASNIIEILGEAVRTAGVDRVLIVDSRMDFAQTIAGLLGEQGYFGEIAVGSREAFRKATQQGTDYELILISDVLDLPVTEMVQLLRRDRRTALLPIGVMVGSDSVDDMPKLFHDKSYRDPLGKIRSRSPEDVSVLLANDSRTYVAPRPHSSESTAFLAQQVRKLGGRDVSSREERLANGRAAIAAFHMIATDKDLLNRFGLLRQEASLITALSNPTLAGPAAVVLGELGTPKAQTALVEIASQPGRTLADRQAAAVAFQAAVKNRGIMLTKQQILQQYERYNLSETLDKPTQAVLASVLDTLESRRTAANQPAANQPATP